MTTCLLTFILAFLVSALITPIVRVAALRLRIVDTPDHYRKIHPRETPRLGGLAIFLAFVGPLAFIYWLLPPNVATAVLRENPGRLLWLVLGAMVALGLGIVDDAAGLRARWKLLFQIIAATVAFLGGFSINAVTNPFGSPIDLGIFAFPITLFWFLGCMNAVNLLDGLDGLAAGVCLFVSLTFFLVSLLFHNVYSMLLMACLSGAILGFLLYNFHPAKIFLGDAGSMLLGYLVAALAILGTRKAETAVVLLIPIIALGLPIFDTSLAILRRWAKKLPLSAPDKQHIHHVLLAMGLSHKRAVLILYLACVTLGAAAVLVTMGHNDVTLMVVGALVIVVAVCVRLFSGIRLADLWQRLCTDLERRQRSAEARVAVEKAVTRMARAATVRELWQVASCAMEQLELDYATLRIFKNNGAQPVELTWQAQENGAYRWPPTEDDLWSARLRVTNNGRLLGELAVGKTARESLLLPDAPELVERLRREMAIHLKRLTPQTL